MLFAFVDQVCEEVRATAPKRINVDCQVNASASLGRGVRGMLGKDMVLTIGLPLLASLSLREFGGVLTHEFGHFTRKGRTASYGSLMGCRKELLRMH